MLLPHGTHRPEEQEEKAQVSGQKGLSSGFRAATYWLCKPKKVTSLLWPQCPSVNWGTLERLLHKSVRTPGMGMCSADLTAPGVGVRSVAT